MTDASRQRRDEQGAAATALLVTAVLVGLTIFVFLAVPYGLAVDAKARNRTAADAAALAGAEGARDALLAAIGPGGVPTWGSLASPYGLGSSEAERYASLNDARLVAYSFEPANGHVDVTVEGQDVDGNPSRSRAVAQVDPLPCMGQGIPTPTPSWTPPPEPTPTPTPTGGPDPTPSPTPTPTPVPADPPTELLQGELSCGPITLTFDFTFEGTSLVDVGFGPGQLDGLRDLMAARLVQ